MSVYMYVEVLNVGCGSISHMFGILVSGCINTHVNGKLEYIRLIFMFMLMYQMMVEGILILRQSTASTHAYVLPLNSITYEPPIHGKTYIHTRHPCIELHLRIRIHSTIV